jgi:hypothetical protein
MTDTAPEPETTDDLDLRPEPEQATQPAENAGDDAGVDEDGNEHG